MKAPVYQWQPTTAEIAAAAGIPESAVERFDHNTSPFPSSWAASVVAGVSSRLNEYPAASYAEVRGAAARATGMSVDRIIPGAGADELILLCGRAFLSPGSSAVQVTPTYPLYAIATAQARAHLTSLSASPPDFAFPAAETLAAAADADVVWLCIPNNPTGARPDEATLRDIIEKTGGLVVIDAAYAEYAGDRWSDWVDEYDNLLVLHTLSKAYGLAGARVGYGLCAAQLVEALDAVRPPGSISSMSVSLAVAALRSPERMQAAVSELVPARDALASSLESFGFRVLSSPTNFLLCEIGPPAAALHAALMAEGLVARKYPADGPLAHYLRFTVRTRDAHRRLVDAIERNLQ